MQKINRFVYILTDFGIGSLVIIIYIGHYFLPIAYIIFILTQRLVSAVILKSARGLEIAPGYIIVLNKVLF